MPLAGQGVVAIWHDLIDAIKPEFYQWHNREHMPERLGIPGFNHGRRFSALSGTPQYFNLYEADSLDVVGGPAYVERLNNPTHWTKQIVPGFRNVSRSVCWVECSLGVGQGGVMLTLRFDASREKTDALRRYLVSEVIPGIAKEPGVAGVHCCRADPAASEIDTAEKKMRATATLVPAWIIMIEGVNRSFVEAARALGAGDHQLMAHGALAPIEAGTYVLEHSCSKTGTRAR